MMRPSVDDALRRVPDYKRFYTMDELRERAGTVADEHPGLVTREIVGHSTDGEPIEMVRIGDGATHVMLFAFPHPNEPIGAMLVHFLLGELVVNDALRQGRSWYLLPSVDPDGARLNEGWFAGPFTIRNYARHFYRPPSTEQVEWTFPIDYKTLRFDRPMPETRALMRAFELARPNLVYSLHNAGFGGVYYYVSEDLPEVYPTFYRVPKERALELSLGEAEMPWATEFAPAVYAVGSIRDAYDYQEAYGEGDPADRIQGGGSSADYLRSMGLPDGPPLTLITELPYFQCAQISDRTPVSQTRREVILEGIAVARANNSAVAELLARIAPVMRLDTRFHRAVRLFNAQALSGLESKERWARDAEGMDAPATVAQRTDELYVGSFYGFLIASMLRRALAAELNAVDGTAADSAVDAAVDAEAHAREGSRGAAGTAVPEATNSVGHEPRPAESLDVLREVAAEVEDLLEGWATRLEGNLEYQAIAIKASVEVQYAALLAVLGSSRFGGGRTDHGQH